MDVNKQIWLGLKLTNWLNLVSPMSTIDLASSYNNSKTNTN